jgi:hypothetical protein
MMKNVLPGLAAAMAALGGLFAQGASAATLTYEGGPIMSSARWVEVVWGNGLASENMSLPGYVGAYLADDAADSGKTTNVFAIDAQYSTPSQVLAYNQNFAGSYEIAPAKCGGATACSLKESEIETELAGQIAGAKLPAPTGNGLTTAYVVLFPKSITITDNSANQSGSTWCAEHGSKTLAGGSHMIFAMVPDLGESGGCGALTTANDNVILDVSHQQNEMLTDPLIAQGEMGWYDTTNGEIGDICVAAGVDYGEETIGAHKWFVQNEWSNVDNKCEVSTKEFSPPSTDFTAAPTANTATFAASGESGNHLGSSIPAGIASYTWDFGDGQTGSGATATHGYAAGGTYTVTLTATDTLGFISRASHQVTVSAPPAPPPPPPIVGRAGLSVPTISSAGGTATASASGVVNSGETVTCPAVGGLCVMTVKGIVESAHLANHKAKNRKIVVVNATITVSPGATAKVVFKLNATGKKLLAAHKHLVVKLTVTVRQGSAAPVLSTHTINVKAPKHRGRKR